MFCKFFLECKRDVKFHVIIPLISLKYLKINAKIIITKYIHMYSQTVYSFNSLQNKSNNSYFAIILIQRIADENMVANSLKDILSSLLVSNILKM